jgi:2-polyprenyl-6-methoxyphenol hydroxylase-like FAD-dependent oxidoreductase
MTSRRAVVVGAGPAGASAALGLVGAGFEVLVLEQRTAWRERVCGGVVNPEGVRHLARLGLVDDVLAGGATWLRETTVWTARGTRGTVPLVRQGTAALGVSRFTLEDVLLRAVKARGAAVRFGHRVVTVTRCGDAWQVVARTTPDVNERYDADLVVLADGRYSSTSAKPATRRRGGWFGWNATFENVGQPPGTLSMHFGAAAYVGLLSLPDGSTNVCGLSLHDDGPRDPWDATWSRMLDASGPLATLAAKARRVSGWRGVGPLPFCPRMRPSEGPLRAGDAAAVGDPYMGEGISRALGTGVLLAAALDDSRGDDAAGLARRYGQLWRRRYTPRLVLGTTVRPLQRHPRAFEIALRTLLAHPAAARLLLRTCHPTGDVRRVAHAR